MRQVVFLILLAIYQGESMMDLSILQSVTLTVQDLELQPTKDRKVQLDAMPYLIPSHSYSGEFLGFKAYRH